MSNHRSSGHPSPGGDTRPRDSSRRDTCSISSNSDIVSNLVDRSRTPSPHQHATRDIATPPSVVPVSHGVSGIEKHAQTNQPLGHTSPNQSTNNDLHHGHKDQGVQGHSESTLEYNHDSKQSGPSPVSLRVLLSSSSSSDYESDMEDTIVNKPSKALVGDGSPSHPVSSPDPIRHKVEALLARYSMNGPGDGLLTGPTTQHSVVKEPSVSIDSTPSDASLRATLPVYLSQLEEPDTENNQLQEPASQQHKSNMKKPPAIQKQSRVNPFMKSVQFREYDGHERDYEKSWEDLRSEDDFWAKDEKSGPTDKYQDDDSSSFEDLEWDENALPGDESLSGHHQNNEAEHGEYTTKERELALKLLKNNLLSVNFGEQSDNQPLDESEQSDTLRDPEMQGLYNLPEVDFVYTEQYQAQVQAALDSMHNMKFGRLIPPMEDDMDSLSVISERTEPVESDKEQSSSEHTIMGDEDDDADDLMDLDLYRRLSSPDIKNKMDLHSENITVTKVQTTEHIPAPDDRQAKAGRRHTDPKIPYRPYHSHNNLPKALLDQEPDQISHTSEHSETESAQGESPSQTLKHKSKIQYADESTESSGEQDTDVERHRKQNGMSKELSIMDELDDLDELVNSQSTLCLSAGSQKPVEGNLDDLVQENTQYISEEEMHEIILSMSYDENIQSPMSTHTDTASDQHLLVPQTNHQGSNPTSLQRTPMVHQNESSPLFYADHSQRVNETSPCHTPPLSELVDKSPTASVHELKNRFSKDLSSVSLPLHSTSTPIQQDKDTHSDLEDGPNTENNHLDDISIIVMHATEVKVPVSSQRYSLEQTNQANNDIIENTSTAVARSSTIAERKQPGLPTVQEKSECNKPELKPRKIDMCEGMDDVLTAVATKNVLSSKLSDDVTSQVQDLEEVQQQQTGSTHTPELHTQPDAPDTIDIEVHEAKQELSVDLETNLISKGSDMLTSPDSNESQSESPGRKIADGGEGTINVVEDSISEEEDNISEVGQYELRKHESDQLGDEDPGKFSVDADQPSGEDQQGQVSKEPSQVTVQCTQPSKEDRNQLTEGDQDVLSERGPDEFTVGSGRLSSSFEELYSSSLREESTAMDDDYNEAIGNGHLAPPGRHSRNQSPNRESLDRLVIANSLTQSAPRTPPGEYENLSGVSPDGKTMTKSTPAFAVTHSPRSNCSGQSVTTDPADEDNIDELFASHVSLQSNTESKKSSSFLSPFSKKKKTQRIAEHQSQDLGTSRESIASFYSDAGEGNYGTIPVTGDILFGLEYNYKNSAFEVFIKQCRDLAPVDTKRKRSDPYVKTYLLPDKTKSGKRKTRVKKHTLNPTFDENLRYQITKSELENRTLWLTVWHNDTFGRNDFLGEVTISMDDYTFNNSTPKWHALQERHAGPMAKLTYKGDLVVALKFVSSDNVMAKRRSRAGERGELHVLIKEATNLTAVRANGTSDPFCKGYLLPEKTKHAKQKTTVRKKDCNPCWNHTFVFEDIARADLRERCLELTVWDHDRFTSNDFLGGVRLCLGTGTSGDRPVEWMDASGKEVTVWQSMLDRPNAWIEGTLPLRSSMDSRRH